MERQSRIHTLTIPINTALSDAFDMSIYASGMVLIPSAWTAANLGFQCSTTEGGTFTWAEACDSADPIQIENIPEAQSVWKEIPPEVFGAPYVKLWSKSATAATETDVNQVAARTLVVMLKS